MKITPVEVEWLDSAGMLGWHPPGELPAGLHCALCRSWGVIAYKDRDEIVLATMVAVNTGNQGHFQAIPRRCIKRIRKLKGV